MYIAYSLTNKENHELDKRKTRMRIEESIVC